VYQQLLALHRGTTREVVVRVKMLPIVFYRLTSAWSLLDRAIRYRVTYQAVQIMVNAKNSNMFTVLRSGRGLVEPCKFFRRDCCASICGLDKR